MKIVLDEKGQVLYPYIVECKDCIHFTPDEEAKGYGSCNSTHTFSGAFCETDFCSYGRKKGVMYT